MVKIVHPLHGSAPDLGISLGSGVYMQVLKISRKILLILIAWLSVQAYKLDAWLKVQGCL